MQQLKDAKKRMNDLRSNSDKYTIVTGKFGSIEDFYCPLRSRIGAPSLEFFKAMEREHCSEKPIPEYTPRATPRNEWEYATLKKSPPPNEMKSGRILPDIDQLMQLQSARNASLTRHEVLAIVLYTGPLYQEYNNELRKRPAHSNLSQSVSSGEGEYSTTIHVLVSAVLKLSRSMKLPENKRLFRGTKGVVDFPKCFFHGDTKGRRGVMELGFMSTSLNREIVISTYSGAKELAPLPTIIEMNVSAVSCGAQISEFSQYQREQEILWVPGCYLEPERSFYTEIKDDIVVRIIPVRVSTPKAMTLEEILDEKKQTHLASFNYMIDEIEREFEDYKEKAEMWAINHVLENCRAVYQRHESMPSESYASDREFKRLCDSMMDVKKLAHAKMQLYIEVDSYREQQQFFYLNLKDADLEEKYMWETKCKEAGLIQQNVEEQDTLCRNRIIQASVSGLDPESITMLVKAKADVNCRGKDGKTPLYCAVSQFLRGSGFSGQVSTLFSTASGFVVRPMHTTYQLRPMTSLHQELSRYLKVIETLIKLGADVNQGEEDWNGSILLQASYAGFVDAVRHLILAKADVNVICASEYDGEFCTSPIHAAAQNGYNDVTEVLVEQKANVNVRCSAGTPLYIAVTNEHLHTVSFLIHCRAEVNSFNGEDGLTPVAAAISVALGTARWNLLEALLESNADINCWSNINEETTIGNFARSGNIHAIRVLAERFGANVDQVDYEDCSPMYHAAAGDHASAIKVLLECGAKALTSERVRSSPIHVAAQNGNLSAIQELLACRVDADAPATDFAGSKTALRIAVDSFCRDGQKVLDVADLLLRHGAQADEAITKRIKSLCMPTSVNLEARYPVLAKLLSKEQQAFVDGPLGSGPGIGRMDIESAENEDADTGSRRQSKRAKQ